MRRTLFDGQSNEQWSLCGACCGSHRLRKRTVTTTVRCAKGKLLSREVEVEELPGGVPVRKDEHLAVGPDGIPRWDDRCLAWKKLEPGKDGEVLEMATVNEGTVLVRVTEKPAVDMDKVTAVVRHDLEETRSRTAERALFVLAGTVCFCASVAFGVFVGGPAVAAALRGLGW